MIKPTLKNTSGKWNHPGSSSTSNAYFLYLTKHYVAAALSAVWSSFPQKFAWISHKFESVLILNKDLKKSENKNISPHFPKLHGSTHFISNREVKEVKQ